MISIKRLARKNNTIMELVLAMVHGRGMGRMRANNKGQAWKQEEEVCKEGPLGSIRGSVLCRVMWV